MTMCYLTGLAAAGQTNCKGLAGFFALALLINAKQSATILFRSTPKNRILPGALFIVQILAGCLLLLPLFKMYSTSRLLPYAIFPAVYLLSLRFLGEHALTTEVLGFTLLSLASLVAKAIVGSGLDGDLFIVTAVFFVAGVFRVRIQLSRNVQHRIIMFCYVLFAGGFYYMRGYHIFLLLPFIDNLIFALTRYRISLKATGWSEMAKGLLFLSLVKGFGYN